MAEDEVPPFSRLFIIGDKLTPDSVYEEELGNFGSVQYVKSVKDKHSGEPKGLVYIKMTKTSAAVKAVEDLNGSTLPGSSRPLKVLIASNRSDSLSDEEIYAQITRLFVVVPKTHAESDVIEQFEKYGTVKKVVIIKDRQTSESKGLAYVTFTKASDAALAYESCGPDFRPKFAEPMSRKRPHDEFQRDRQKQDFLLPSRTRSAGVQDMLTSYPNCGRLGLKVRVPKGLTQVQMTRLFNIVPTLEYCRLVTNQYSVTDTVFIRYSSPGCCSYARESFNGFEYPPGCPLECEYHDDSETFGQVKSEYAATTHASVNQSPTTDPSASHPAPFPHSAPDGAEVKKRLFVVSQPERISIAVLVEKFRMFGSFIGFSYIPGKNFGFAKFASVESADSAQNRLHGEMIGGNKLKCLEAEEPPESKRHRV